MGLIVVDNFDEIDRLGALTHAPRRPGRPRSGSRPTCAGRPTITSPPARPTRSSASPWPTLPTAIARIEGVAGLRLMGLHAHIGSQLLELEPFRREVAELARLGEFGVWDLGGGLGVHYTADQPAPPAVEDYVATLVEGARTHGMGEPGRRLLIEPGRSLVANAGVTLYTVESRQAQRLPLGRRRRRDVRQPAPDALRRALRSARGRPLRGRDDVRARGQALRVRRRDRARARCSTIPGRAM